MKESGGVGVGDGLPSHTAPCGSLDLGFTVVVVDLFNLPGVSFSPLWSLLYPMFPFFVLLVQHLLRRVQGK